MKLQNVLNTALVAAATLRGAHAKGGSAPEGTGAAAFKDFDIGNSSFQISTLHSYNQYAEDCQGRPFSASQGLYLAIKSTCGNGTFGAFAQPASKAANQQIAKGGYNCGNDLVYIDVENEGPAQRCVEAVVNSNGNVKSVGPDGAAKSAGPKTRVSGPALGLAVLLGAAATVL
jgi:hypothetical protein